MRIVCFILLSFFTLHTSALALTHGMTTKEVRKEIGKAESTLAMGNKEVLIYPNGDKLVFLDGGLHSLNGIPLARKNTEVSLTGTIPESSNKPLLDDTFEQETTPKNNLNIVETVQEPAPAIDTNGEEYSYGEYMDNFQDSLDQYEEARHDAAYGEEPPTAKERALGLLLGFIAEFIITLIVLKIAFQIVGFPCLWRQLFILSITVSLGSLLVNYVLGGGLFSPVRNGLAFIIMLLMIPKLTDVREWTTAISIAITARVVSIVLMWLVFGVLMMAVSSFY